MSHYWCENTSTGFHCSCLRYHSDSKYDLSRLEKAQVELIQLMMPLFPLSVTDYDLVELSTAE